MVAKDERMLDLVAVAAKHALNPSPFEALATLGRLRVTDRRLIVAASV